jgi:hypothetical protein
MKWLRDLALADGVAVVLLAASATSFWLGSSALARAEDLKAFYWLVVGVVTVRAAVEVARPGAKA